MHSASTHRRVMTRRYAFAAVGTASALLLAACGSGDGSLGGETSSNSASSGGDGQMTSISVGVIPILDVAPIYLGVKQGFFEDEGLDVKLELAQGGAAIVPAVVSEQYQFGFSNTTSLLLATDKGLPIKAVASGNQAGPSADEDFEGLVTAADSGITSPKDLAGKKVGVNTLNNIMTTTINKLVRDDGGDPSGIQYVELAFPDMAAAVAKGDVAAGTVVEPFLTVSKSQGLKVIGSNFAGVEPAMQVALYFTSAAYMEKYPEVVDKFTSAMNKSLTYASEH